MERYWIVYLVLLVKTTNGLINIYENTTVKSNYDEHFNEEDVINAVKDNCGVNKNDLLSMRITGFNEFKDVLDYNTFRFKLSDIPQ